MCRFWNCLCNRSYVVLARLLELRVIQWFQSWAFFFFFFFSLPSPATLSLSNLFGLQISFPNSVSAVLLSEQFSREKSTWVEL